MPYLHFSVFFMGRKKTDIVLLAMASWRLSAGGRARASLNKRAEVRISAELNNILSCNYMQVIELHAINDNDIG